MDRYDGPLAGQRSDAGGVLFARADSTVHVAVLAAPAESEERARRTASPAFVSFRPRAGFCPVCIESL